MSSPEINVTWKGRLVAIVIGLVFLTGISEVALRIIYPTWNEFFAGRFLTVEHVPEFGDVAVGRAGFDGYFSQNNGDFRSHIRINAFGLRNDESIDAADGRVWIIGDSMAFGWGVDGEQMYSSVIADLLNRQTYNVASPGTNICGYHALAGRMPANSKPSAIVVGLILENDLHEYDCAAYRETNRIADHPPGDKLTTLKLFLTENSALYNFFAVALKRVDVVRELLIWAGVVQQEQAYKNPLAERDISAVTESTAQEIQHLKAMFDPSTPFVVLVAPSRFEIASDDPNYREIRESMRDALTRLGIDFVDPIDAFKAAGFEATHFIHDGHWSANGHRVSAAAVTDWLRANTQ